MFETFFFFGLTWLVFFGGEVAHEIKARILSHHYHYNK